MFRQVLRHLNIDCPLEMILKVWSNRKCGIAFLHSHPQPRNELWSFGHLTIVVSWLLCVLWERRSERSLFLFHGPVDNLVGISLGREARPAR
jgi:hypothetical protein